MHFKRGLHPFYPPTVQLLRPRCRAPLLGALSSHPMLQLAAWDPWRPQKDLIEQLRLFLQVRSLYILHDLSDGGIFQSGLSNMRHDCNPRVRMSARHGCGQGLH